MGKQNKKMMLASSKNNNRTKFNSAQMGCHSINDTALKRAHATTDAREQGYIHLLIVPLCPLFMLSFCLTANGWQYGQ